MSRRTGKVMDTVVMEMIVAVNNKSLIAIVYYWKTNEHFR